MKIILTAAFLLYTLSFFAKSEIDSTQNSNEIAKISTNNEWQFHGNIQLNNNGISPVPAFSLGKPSIMTTLLISKGNFTYAPEFNYGLDGLPWALTNWFRYRLTKNKFRFGFGSALSFFFRREKVITNGVERTIAPMNQYSPFEFLIGHNFSEKTSVNLNYWRSKGWDYGSVKSGNFMILSGNFSKINVSKSIQMDIHPNLFYIKNVIPFEGFFGSMIIGFSGKKSPFHPFIQLVQPFWVGQGVSDFNWNYGVNYVF